MYYSIYSKEFDTKEKSYELTVKFFIILIVFKCMSLLKLFMLANMHSMS